MGFCHFTREQAEARVPHPRLQGNQEDKDILPAGQGTDASSVWLGNGSRPDFRSLRPCRQGQGAQGLPSGTEVKNLPANAGGEGLIPGSGRSPGGRYGNSLLYSCLENPKDRGAWWAIVMGSQRVRHGLVTKKQGTQNPGLPLGLGSKSTVPSCSFQALSNWLSLQFPVLA